MPVLASLAISTLLLAPLLLGLAPSPQSPDGAEMLMTALHGGVMHPSGLPLQAWLDRLAVALLPADPGLALSLLSWISAVGTVTLLLLTLRRVGVQWIAAVPAAIAYAYLPTVAAMSVIPEKYALLSCTQMLFVYLLVAEAPAPALAFALGLALAQHSANIILVLPFLYVLLRPIVRFPKDWYNGLKVFLANGLLAGVVTFGFYASLLWLRGEAVWPDWGHLQSLQDVLDHALRRDYGLTQLYNTPAEGTTVSALPLLAKGFLGWNLSVVFVPLGFFALLRLARGRYLSALWLMMILPGLGILAQTKMPAADADTVMGYQERYPLLLWPLISLYWGVGLSFALRYVARWERQAIALLTGPLLLFAYQGAKAAVAADNNLAEIYRDQARLELDDFGIFWTGSDFTAFYGVPVSSGILFPVKNMIGFDWYREEVLPTLSRPIARIFQEHRPANLPALFRQALNEGFRIVATEPTAVLQEADLMKSAEQTGVLWNFHTSNSGLYTKRIVANTLQLCTRLPNVKRALPLDGQYFLREYLKSFHFAFLSAGDYLEAQGQAPAAEAARKLAESLQPGIEPIEWRLRCEAYQATLR